MDTTNMMQSSSERERLLNELRSYKLAAYDLALFLNTHPTDKRALAMHKSLSEKARAAEEQFQKQFGPLTMSGVTNTECWDWINSPWPWEEQ